MLILLKLIPLVGPFFILVYLLFCSFLDDVEVMLHWRPPVVYRYLWKYVCLFGMVGLLAASLLRMVFKRPTYTAWNHTTVLYKLR